MKRFALLALGLLIIVAVAGFAGPARETAKKEVTIGLSMPSLDAPYWKVWIEGFKKSTEKLGWKYVTTDGEGILNQQIDQIEDLYHKKVDALVIVPLDAKGLVPIINKIYNDSGKKFPMITANVMTDPPVLDSLVGYAGPNPYDEAAKLAEAFIGFLKQKGIQKISGVMITGEPGYSDTIDREKGFVETLKKLGWQDKIIFLDKQPGNWMMDEAQKVMENFLTTYGDKIQFVYGQDGTMVYGAWGAIQGAGYKPGQVYLLGIGGQKEELQLIQDGAQLFSIDQPPSADSAKALEVLQKVLSGQKVEYYNYINTPVVTKDNVKDFLPGEW